MYCHLLFLQLFNRRQKKIIYQLRKQLKIYEINQRLKLWARVPIAVSSHPAAAHMCRRSLRNQKYLIIAIFTVCLNVTLNGNMSSIYQTEIIFLTRKIECKLWKVQFFLVKAAVKFRNLQISKILNTDTNRVFPIPFKVMYISLRYI